MTNQNSLTTMKNIILAFLFILSTCLTYAQPANDDCSNAIDIGTLPAPNACGYSSGGESNGTISLAGCSNVGATPNLLLPPSYCGTTGGGSAIITNISGADVWYTFVAGGPAIDIMLSNITGIDTVQFTMYESMGNGDCSDLIFADCGKQSASSGAITFSFGNGFLGKRYWIRLSGIDPSDQGTWDITIDNTRPCDACLMNHTLTANPAPINGTYLAGTTVTFTYTVQNYKAVATNWFHGIAPVFGAGWDQSTLTNLVPASSCKGTGEWIWYPTGITGQSRGTVTPPGFFFESSSYDNDAGNNLGDGSGDCDYNNATWTFSWTITTKSSCGDNDLTIDIENYGDGETGSWTSYACDSDPNYVFQANLSCCDTPNLVMVNENCGAGDGTIQVTGDYDGSNNPFSYEIFDDGNNSIGTSNNNPADYTFTGLSEGTYYVFSTDNNGCRNGNTIAVGNNSSPTASITYPKTNYCKSETTNPVGSATGNYSESTNTVVFVSTTTGEINLAQTPAGTYTIDYQMGSGACSATDDFDITISGGPNVSVSADTLNICLGASATFSASGGASYEWTHNNDNNASQTESPSVSTDYEVTATDASGCEAYDTVHVAIRPVEILEGDTLTFCGANTFNLTTTDYTGMTYEWSEDNGGSYTTPAPSHQFTTSSISTNTHVILSAGNACTNKDTIFFIDINNADPTFSYPAAVVCKNLGINPSPDNTTGTFSEPSGNLVWVNANTGEININNTPAGSYTITHTISSGDPLCPDLTSDFNIRVSDGPTLSMNADTIDICVGNSATMTASGATTYTWTHNNDNNASQTESPLVSTDYEVLGVDADGCEAYDTVRVNVGNVPTLTITGADTINICPGASAELYATSSEAINNWSWDQSVGNTGNLDSIEAMTVNPGVETTYTLSVTSTYGCSVSADVTVAVGGYIPQVAQSNITICSGETASLEVTGANNIRWSIYGDTIATTAIHNVTLDTVKSYTYTVTAEDNSGCVGQNTVNVTVNELPIIDAGDYSSCNAGDLVNIQATQTSGNSISSWNWDHGKTGSAINETPNADIEYIITVTDVNNCTNFDTAFVTVGNYYPTIISSTGRYICSNDTIELEVLNAPTINYWTDLNNTPYGNGNPVEIPTSSLNIGQNIFTVNASQGSCTGTDTFLVNVVDTPTISFTLSDAGTLQSISNNTVCPGQEVILSVSSNNATQYAFANSLGTILQNSTSDSYTTSNINDGDIFVVAVSNGTCASVSFTLPFTISPPLSLNAGNDSSICVGNDITLSGSMSFGDGQWYQSSIDPSNALGNLNDSILTYNNINAGQNVFLWQVNDPNCGVNYIDSLVVTGLENQVNLFIDTDEDGDTLIPIPSTLYTLSTGQTSLTWAVNDSTVGTGNDLSYTFTEPGTQVITLTAIDENGCLVVDSMTIMIDAPLIMHFPNAFTPNVDGTNDVFRPVGYFDNLEEYEFNIYNRWGDLVFTSIDQTESWNGKMLNTGVELIQGVYTYIVKYRAIGGFEDEQIMGSVILLR